MLKINLSDQGSITSSPAYVFLAKESDKKSASKDCLQAAFNIAPELEQLLQAHKFVGKEGQQVTVMHTVNGELTTFVFVGLGDIKPGNSLDNMEALRNGIWAGVCVLKKLGVQSAVCNLLCKPTQENFGLEQNQFATDCVVAAHMSAYSFDEFKKKSDDHKPWECELTFCVQPATDCVQALEQGNIIGEAMNFTRRLQDLPSNVANTTFMRDEAVSVAKRYSLSSRVIEADEAKEMGMGGLLAVGGGSINPPRMVELKYDCGNADAPTIAIVGKGICFDTGGVSLKPTSYMKDMKYDMSGAAAVIGAMQAIAQLKPQVSVVGITPLAENLLGAGCYRVDDIITHLNGVTTEVQNTDAEGRMILADGLAYADKFCKPDALLSVATLTGACPVALGNQHSGLMSYDDALANKITEAGNTAGDWVWRLPLTTQNKKAMESKVADVRQCRKGSFGGGSTCPAVFLHHFVGKRSWAHIDIAGTAHEQPLPSYKGCGGTGAGLRLLVEFVRKYS